MHFPSSARKRLRNIFRRRLLGIYVFAVVIVFTVMNEDIIKYIKVKPLLRKCPSSYLLPVQRRYGIQCDRLLSGDTDYIKWVGSQKMSLSNRGCVLSLSISNCTDFTSTNGYKMKRISVEEKQFPIAFGIKVHKDPGQAEQLLRTIYRPHNIYCIHVDLKVGETVSEPLLNLAKCLDNVFVVRKYRVVYSSIRQPLADIACMKKVMSTGANWKYYLILAGQEFVLKTNLEIVRILKILNGTNDIEAYPFPKHLQWRYTYSHPITGDSISKKSQISKSPFQRNISLYKGSSYGMFSREFVKFILEDDVSKDLFEWAEDTFAPEEMIWGTLNALPGAPVGYKVHTKHTDQMFLSRAMIWAWDKIKCHGKFVRSICVFSFKDLPWLVSSPEVVANKFSLDEDRLVLDCLEEWVQKKALLGTTINMNWYHYRHIAHVRA